jgi:hypothetical protein
LNTTWWRCRQGARWQPGAQQQQRQQQHANAFVTMELRVTSWWQS